MFEHVFGVEETLSRLRECLKPGGIAFHQIDLSGHNSEKPFWFHDRRARQSDSEALNQLNGLRLSDYIGIFDAFGDHVEILHKQLEEARELEGIELSERLRGYERNDLLTSRVKLLIQKRPVIGGSSGEVVRSRH